MRKIFVNPIILLLLVASMFVVNSCNKGEDIHEADLIGTWDIGQASVDIKVGPISLINFLRTALQLSEQEAESMLDDLITEFDYISGGTITFNADYTYLMVNGDFEEHGTWELDGDKLYLTITGDILEGDPVTIESLNGSSGILVLEDEQEVDTDEDGNSEFTATIVIEVDITKQ